MNIYLVDTGDYEESRTIAVFDSKEQAEQLASLVGGTVSTPFELNHFEHDEPPTGKLYFCVRIQLDGLLTRVSLQPSLTEFGYLRSCGHAIEKCSRPPTFVAELYAESEEEATKVANTWLEEVLADIRPEHCYWKYEG